MNEVLRPVRRWSWGWLWLTFACLIGQPSIMYVVARIVQPGAEELLGLGTAFETPIAFFAGPLSLVWGVATSLKVVFSLPSDEVFHICCGPKDEEVYFLVNMLGPLAMPSGLMCMLLLGRFARQPLGLPAAAAMVAAATCLAHASSWYFAWRMDAICTSLQCP